MQARASTLRASTLRASTLRASSTLRRAHLSRSTLSRNLPHASLCASDDPPRVVQAAIDSMIAAGGMTVLVIAHRLSTIRNADRILVIQGGRVAESGTHSVLLAAGGEYAKLVNRQMAGGAGASADA